MKDIIVDDFQETVNDVLFRHKSIIDVMTKLQESDARLNRAIAKAVTSCGCIKISITGQHRFKSGITVRRFAYRR
jgi:hypothetical protein